MSVLSAVEAAMVNHSLLKTSKNWWENVLKKKWMPSQPGGYLWVENSFLCLEELQKWLTVGWGWGVQGGDYKAQKLAFKMAITLLELLACCSSRSLRAHGQVAELGNFLLCVYRRGKSYIIKCVWKGHTQNSEQTPETLCPWVSSAATGRTHPHLLSISRSCSM